MICRMRTAVLLALAMFVATPIVQLAAERDAAAQLWKPRSRKKAKAKAPTPGDAKAKTAAKTSRKAKAKAPTRAKKKPTAKKPRKASKRKAPADPAADDDFAIFEETEGDLE
jgi:hypothetical protein